MKQYIIGIDFGTASARAILVDAESGSVAASAAENYPRWAKGLYCSEKEQRYRQHPADHIHAMEKSVREVAAKLPEGARVAGIGIDATCSTPILLGRELRPLSDSDPDAMFVLWKDHSSVAEAREISAAAGPYTSHSGGTYSAENFWAKLLHILRTNPEMASKANTAVELCDYIPFLLTGKLRPSRCAAGSKQMWGREWGGFPPAEFFGALDPRLGQLRANMEEENFTSSTLCGTLTEEWASRLGLPAGIPVSAGNIDAHSGAVGGGCSEDTLVATLGTSACLMAVGKHQSPVPGVFGQVEDSIIPGMDGYEMGLSAFGDNFAWLSRLTGRSMEALTEEASALNLSEGTPVCTDWFNGRRSPAPEPDASASVQGLRLTTTPGGLFYAIVEGSCFGIKAIVEHLAVHGVAPERFVATGGIPHKSPFVMQMLADVLERPVSVSPVQEACALGAAINASVAAGIHPNVAEAQKAMCPEPTISYTPSGTSHAGRYELYRKHYEDA